MCLSIVGGFTLAPMLCVAGVVCYVLPAAPTLQDLARTLITLGIVWTVLAIVMTNLVANLVQSARMPGAIAPRAPECLRREQKPSRVLRSASVPPRRC